MSGTAPSDPAPGGHATDRGVEQTSLDSNQHGATQNILDETKDTAGTGGADRDIGRNIDATKEQGGFTNRVDEILNQPSDGSTIVASQAKAEAKDEEGFRVGEEKDMHDLAQAKQP